MRVCSLSHTLNVGWRKLSVISLSPTPATRLNLSTHRHQRRHLYYNHHNHHEVPSTYRSLQHTNILNNNNNKEIIQGAERRIRQQNQHQCRRCLTTHGQDQADSLGLQETRQRRRRERNLERPRRGLVLGRHVREALANGCPIVALESTVITHGLPEPQNLELALTLEAEISEGRWWRDDSQHGDDENLSSTIQRVVCADGPGSQLASSQLIQQREGRGAQHTSYSGVVTPATIGIVKGQLVIGLSRDEIEYLATREASHPIKASRRDLPIAMALGLSGGTTVSGTMAIAASLQAPIWRQLANDTNAIINHNHQIENLQGPAARQQQQQRPPPRAIKVFATGGMGGVHLGGESSMDVSADLYEFARSPIGVVSSGFKSFLDTRRSLEFLETMGCTVTSLQGGYKSTYEASSSYPSSSCDLDDKKAAYLSKPQGGNTTTRSENHNNRHDYSQSDLNQFQRLAKGHQFPGFFTTTNKEHVKSPWQCQSVQEAARILFQCLEGPRSMLLGGGGGGGGGGGNHHDDDGSIVAAESLFNLHGGSPFAPSPLAYESRAMLLACPIPSDFSLDIEDPDYRRAMDTISSSIDRRLDLSGAEKTPLILAQLNEATGGKTLRANVELLRNNSRIAAHLAYEYTRVAGQYNRPGAILPPSTANSTQGSPVEDNVKEDTRGSGCAEAGHRQRPSELVNHQVQGSAMGAEKGVASGGSPLPPSAVLVVGCTMIDMHVSTKIDDQFKANPRHSGVTFEGRPHLALGGVGRNLATAVRLLGHGTTFVTSLGADNLAAFALNELDKCGLDVRSGSLQLIHGAPSGQPEASTCFALVLMDSLSGQCEFVVANLEANKRIDARHLIKFMKQQQQQQSPSPKLIVLDANLPPESVECMLAAGTRDRVPVFVEPTDVVCLERLVDCLINSSSLESLAFMSPNVIELAEMLALFERKKKHSSGTTTRETTTLQRIDSSQVTREQVELMARQLMESHLSGLKCLLVTMDKRGALVAVRRAASCAKKVDEQELGQINLMDEIDKSSQSSMVATKYFETPQVVERPVSASGAGDSFAAGFISGLLGGLNLAGCMNKAFRAAQLALQDRDTISSKLSQLK